MANERRTRGNFLTGTITDNPLIVGATTVNAAELAAVPVVNSTQHMIMVLDPFADDNGPEAVAITAHASGATAATIARGREDTTEVEHPLGTRFAISPVVSDFTTVVATSASLPTAPYEGQECWIMDSNRLVVWNGAAWRDVYSEAGWTAFTPLITGGWILSDGVATGRYRLLGGDTVVAEAWYARGGSNMIANPALDLQIGNLPFSNGSPKEVHAVASAFRSSTSLRVACTGVMPSGSNVVHIKYHGVFAAPGAVIFATFDLANPFAWATGDEVHMNIVYPKA